MVIGIEAQRANHPQKTGVEHYAKQLILHLAEIDRHNQYVLYLRTRPEGWFLNLPENFKIKVMPFPVFWTQARLSLELAINPVDALVIPASALPLIHPKNSIVVIHDLAWLFYPETFTWFNRIFLSWSSWYAARAAKKVIAVSEATKKDLLKKYRMDQEKISVVHHGYENSQGTEASGIERLKLPEKYVLFLSTLQPRKNLTGLIEAFEALKKEHPDLPHKLVVVGKPGWKFQPILKKIQDSGDLVLYLNHVSDSDRMEIMSRADLLVLPSFYEGFGMQILEAFSTGVPVATASVSSMPEVAGEAAVYFDPKKTGEIKLAMLRVLTDKSLSDSLIDKGRRRLSLFSWEKCARQTLEVIEK